MYVHRGNIWDKEFYLSEVTYMSQYDIAYGSGGLLEERYPSDVIWRGYSAVCSDRPIVPLLCATIAGKGWGDLFFQAYLFIVMLWAAVFGPMMLALEIITEGIKTRKIKENRLYFLQAFFALAYIWGFYGQIQYDIDAWS